MGCTSNPCHRPSHIRFYFLHSQQYWTAAAPSMKIPLQFIMKYFQWGKNRPCGLCEFQSVQTNIGISHIHYDAVSEESLWFDHHLCTRKERLALQWTIQLNISIQLRSLRNIAAVFIQKPANVTPFHGTQLNDAITRTFWSHYGQRAFSTISSRLWNGLPNHIRTAENVSCFKTRLKTHLFRSQF